MKNKLIICPLIKRPIVMASVLSIDNNTNGNFDSFSFEGENYFDTRNNRKHSNKRIDPQKAKWQSLKAKSEESDSPDDSQPGFTQPHAILYVSPQDFKKWTAKTDKKFASKGSAKRDRAAKAFASVDL